MLLVDVLTSNSLHHLRTSQEHVRCAFHHQREVGEGGGVHSTASAGTEDTRNLGDYTRGQDVALEDLGVASQGVDTFLNTCTTRVIDTDHGSTHLHGHIHHLADLLAHGL